MDFNITSHKCLSSKFNFQDAAGLKVKVTVALFRKKNVIALAPAFMNGFRCIFTQLLDSRANVSSKFNFQLAGLKVKATVAILRKIVVITLALAFINGF